MPVKQVVTRPLPADVPLGTYRPVVSDRGVGTWLRRLAGVREEILDWVPEERPRYTRLGAIVVNTGLLAGLSLLVALSRLVDAPWIVVVPAAAMWAFVIVSFDSWLIASTHGLLTAGKARIFVPRLLISLLMGAVIAEPLLLWVFQPAIHKEVQDFRQQEIVAYESSLRDCNPANGDFVATAQCADLHVNIRNSPFVAKQELTTVKANQVELQKTVTALSAEWDKKEKFARDECGGASGEGLSGIRGDGNECKRNRAIADRFKADSQLGKHQADLVALNTQIDLLTVKVAEAEKTASEQISTAITEKVDERRAHQGKIGILDEAAALGRLSAESGFVFAAQWLVRLLLIAIDCMPVLAKMLGGSSRYDMLVARQITTSGRLHDKHVGMREQQDTDDMDVQMRRFEQNKKIRMKNIDEEDRAARAKYETDLDAEIDALAAKLRAQS